MARCKATNAAGSPCSAGPILEDGLCFWHSPSRAAERDAGRRRGGEGRSNAARARKQLPPGITPEELHVLLGATLRGVISGRLEPGVGNAAANLARALVVVHEHGELAQRLQALEESAAITRGA